MGSGVDAGMQVAKDLRVDAMLVDQLGGVFVGVVLEHLKLAGLVTAGGADELFDQAVHGHWLVVS